MTEEDKEILLKDLCARLSYGVKVLDNSHKNYGASKLINIGIDGSMLIDNEINDIQYYPNIDETKPYLRPISSMTEEEEDMFVSFTDTILRCGKDDNLCCLPLDAIDWLNAHHFDYRGLIEKGIAIVAPEGMYKVGDQ